jgi:stage II sporulation protein Q
MREEEKQNSTKNGSKLQRILRRRWVFPAIYIASAALILTGVLWFQSTSNVESPNDDSNFSYEAPSDNGDSEIEQQEAVEVSASQENFMMPLHDEEGVYIYKPFYDYDADSEEQAAALVYYDNTYYPNTGVDYAMESGDSFDVLASLSGTVIDSDKDEILGSFVKIEHEDGVVTQYSSLDEVHVEVGQSIKQGDVIATAGSNVFNKDAGVHVHFEIRKDGEPVNPVAFLDKPLAALLEQAKEESQNVNSDSDAPEEAEEGDVEEEEPSEEEADPEAENNENESLEESTTRA